MDEVKCEQLIEKIYATLVVDYLSKNARIERRVCEHSDASELVITNYLEISDAFLLLKGIAGDAGLAFYG